MASFCSLLTVVIISLGTSNGDPTYNPGMSDDDATCPMISQMSCPMMSLSGSDDVIQMVPKRLADNDYRLPNLPEMVGIERKLICAEPDCLSNPCVNGGSCRETYDGYQCLCSGCHAGTNCAVTYRDCTEIYNAGERTSGVYKICPDSYSNQEPILVYCNMDKTGGWLIFQRRYDGSVDFYRDWIDYKDGFGNLDTEFWLGNDVIHRITAQAVYKLRIDMVDINGTSWSASYKNFGLANERDKYRLHLEYLSSNASDALSYHNLQAFSTRDQDNDIHYDGRVNCAVDWKGAWWYKNCHKSNLNGIWSRQNGEGMKWKHGTNDLYMQATTMEIQAINY